MVKKRAMIGKVILTLISVIILICAISISVTAADPVVKSLVPIVGTPQTTVQNTVQNVVQSIAQSQAAAREVYELTRCKKTSGTAADGFTPATTSESYLLRDKSCEGQLNFVIDSSKDELGYSYKTKISSALTQIVACEKRPEVGAATVAIVASDSATPCSGYSNSVAHPLGYAYKTKPTDKAVKPLYACSVGLDVKPREVSCGFGYNNPVAWVLADKPEAPPVSNYGTLYRCKKTVTQTGQGMAGIDTTTATHYRTRAECQRDYSLDSSMGELGYVVTSKKHPKMVPLLSCEKPEGGGTVSLSTSTYCQSSNFVKTLGYVFKESRDAPQAFKVKALYSCLGGAEAGEIKPSATDCGALGGNAVAWVSVDNTQAMPKSACEDNRDNDGDGVRDAQDPGCTAPLSEDDDEFNAQQCRDSIDNDGDGKKDSEDPNCQSESGASASCPECPPPSEQVPSSPSSCEDNAFIGKLESEQPELVSTPWTPADNIDSMDLGDVKTRVRQDQAMIQHIICRNKCLRTAEFENENCNPVETGAGTGQSDTTADTTTGWNALELTIRRPMPLQGGVTIELLSIIKRVPQKATVQIAGRTFTLTKGQPIEIGAPNKPKIIMVLVDIKDNLILADSARIRWKMSGTPADSTAEGSNDNIAKGTINALLIDSIKADTITGKIIALIKGF